MSLGLVTNAKTSARLAKIPQSGTGPELAVRKVAHEIGLRYRVRNRDLPGSPDLANRNKKWAIFVHGCYWHHHEGCPRATVPKWNKDFWLDKFATNRERDERVVNQLEDMGFRVLTIWECETHTLDVLERKLNRLLRENSERS